MYITLAVIQLGMHEWFATLVVNLTCTVLCRRVTRVNLWFT